MEITQMVNWTTSGDISIEPVATVPYWSWRFLLMGPTGSGKSSFIEVLKGESQNLSISKDQLSGHTQEVCAYKLVNVTRLSVPIYLIDTPGFSDSKISDIEITEMVSKWLEDNGHKSFDRIYFLTPITDTRLTGSKRRTIKMLKTLLKTNDWDGLGSIIFVTTRWDMLHNDHVKQRAESRFAQLRDEVFKEFIQGGSDLTKFMNTKASAFEIIYVNAFGDTELSTSASSTAPHLYQDLHQRIENALQVKRTIELELSQPEAQADMELSSILVKNHHENEETLNKFIGQFVHFVSPPAGFYLTAQQLRKTIAANVQPMNSEYEELFRKWTEEPEILEEPSTISPSASLRAMESSDRRKALALRGLIHRALHAMKRNGSK
ncbi:hypothetical protein BJ165DRAFT_1598514 [Panaeolus papilionaceus]|nr:hypothetical protein BJ165DRAFT_1598514 [Panaeolus papilionaceus]